MKKIFAFLKNRGFTLVEALVATIIAGYCILPIMGTLQSGIERTQGFDHKEKLRLLARSRLNKELSVGAFDHTAIDTTTTYHYIYYNSDAEPKLLTIDTNLASGATEAGIALSPLATGTFLDPDYSSASSILYSYKVSVAVKENLKLGTSTANIKSDFVSGVSGLKAVTVMAELEPNDNVVSTDSISLFSLLNIPSFSDDYIWISNPKNVEIIAIDPISRTRAESFLLPLDNDSKSREDASNDTARPWNIAIHPSRKFIAIQCKQKIKALNIDRSSPDYGKCKEIWPQYKINSTDYGSAYGQLLADVKKDDKNKAVEDKGIVFRPDGKFCYVAAHDEKKIFSFVASNTENWENLALLDKTEFTTTKDKNSALHAGADGWLYVGPKDANKVIRYPMYHTSIFSQNGQEITDPSNKQVLTIDTLPDGKRFFILWQDNIITRHDSITGEKVGQTVITPTPSGICSDMVLSGDGRYLCIVDAGSGAGKGGFFLLNLSTHGITGTNYSLTDTAVFKKADPNNLGKKEKTEFAMYVPQSNEFIFDEEKKPFLFNVDIPGMLSDSYSSGIPDDRVINFAAADKSQVAFTARKPSYLLVGLDDKSVNFVDVNTGKANETMKIPVEAVPVDVALTPRGEKFKVIFGTAGTGVDTYDIPTRARTHDPPSAAEMFEVAIPNTYFHTDPNQTTFSTLEKHSTNSGLNGYSADVPLPGTPPSDYRMPNNVNFSCDWVPQNMVSLTDGGFLYLFKKADGSTCLEWVGNRPWGPLANNYERFARWFSFPTPVQLPGPMQLSSTDQLDAWSGHISLLRHVSFPVGTTIATFSFVAGQAGALTPVIVEISGGVNTIRDIASPINVAGAGTYHHTTYWLHNGGLIKKNYYPGWWHGGGGPGPGVVYYQNCATGSFCADYAAAGSPEDTSNHPISSLSLNATISDSVNPNAHYRIYEAMFLGTVPDTNFPPQNAINLAVSPDDRFLAIETTGNPNQIHLYDFATNNFYHETQQTGLISDFRKLGNDPASPVYAQASFVGSRKLSESLTRNEPTLASLRTQPTNFYNDATSAFFPSPGSFSTRLFGYFRPSANVYHFSAIHRDGSRIFFNSNPYVKYLDNWVLFSGPTHCGPEAKLIPASSSVFLQIEHSMDDNITGIAAMYSKNVAAAFSPTPNPPTAGVASYPDYANWSHINSADTRPFEFKPTWLRTYNLTGCDNDQVSAIVWSRDLGNPILFHLDTIQDDFWAIKPGMTAPTRFDMGGTFDSADRQLVVSDDGQKLIFAKEDTNEVIFIDISNPASFSFNGATRTVSTLTGFGSIARIATMTASPKVLATLPFNRYKSTPHSGSYQQVATLSVNISGLQNAALASGGIYILGGAPTMNGAFGGSVTTDGAPTDKIFKFDPTYAYAPGFAITPLVATLTRPVKRHAVVAYDNELYVFNGRYTATDNTSWVQKYNPATGMVSSSIDPITATLEEIVVSRTMTSSSAPAPTSVAHTGSVYSTFEGWKAFDGDKTTYGNQWSPSSANQTVKYDAVDPSQKFIVNKIKVSNYDSNASNDAMKTFDFLGDATVLLSNKSMTNYNSTQDFVIPSPGLYQSYSLKAISKWNGGTSAGFTVSEIQLMLSDLRRISPLGTPTTKDHTNRIYTYSDGKIVKASHQEATSDTEAAWRAFDGVVSGNPNQWDSNSGSFATNPPWLSVDLGAGKEDVVDIIRFIYEINDEGLKTFKFQGSNVVNPGTASDSADWVTLNLGGSNIPTTTNVRAWFHYHVTNPGKYRHYRIVCLSSWGTDIELWEVEMFSTQPPPLPAELILTKTLNDSRVELVASDFGACVTPYGIMRVGGMSNHCSIYWPHGIDNYTDNASYSLGISKSLPTLPASRMYHSVVWHKGRVFRVGGSDGATLNSIDVFSFDTNAWTNVALTNVASFPVNGAQLKRDNAAACSLGDEIFVFGGYDGTTLKNDAIAWNPETGNIRLLGTMPMAGNYAKSAVACGSSIYLIGGATNATSGGTAGIWKFTP